MGKVKKIAKALKNKKGSHPDAETTKNGIKKNPLRDNNLEMDKRSCSKRSKKAWKKKNCLICVSGIYIGWRCPEFTWDCQRVSSMSKCFCGHLLGEHAQYNSRWTLCYMYSELVLVRQIGKIQYPTNIFLYASLVYCP